MGLGATSSRPSNDHAFSGGAQAPPAATRGWAGSRDGHEVVDLPAGTLDGERERTRKLDGCAQSSGGASRRQLDRDEQTTSEHAGGVKIDPAITGRHQLGESCPVPLSRNDCILGHDGLRRFEPEFLDERHAHPRGGGQRRAQPGFETPDLGREICAAFLVHRPHLCHLRCLSNDYAFSGGAQAPSAATRGSTAHAASSGNQHLKERAPRHPHDDPEAPIPAIGRKALIYEPNRPLAARTPIRWFAWKTGSLRDGYWNRIPRVVPSEPERALERTRFIRGQPRRAHIRGIGKLGVLGEMRSSASPDHHHGGEKHSAEEEAASHIEGTTEHGERSPVCRTILPFSGGRTRERSDRRPA